MITQSHLGVTHVALARVAAAVMLVGCGFLLGRVEAVQGELPPVGLVAADRTVAGAERLGVVDSRTGGAAVADAIQATRIVATKTADASEAGMFSSDLAADAGVGAVFVQETRVRLREILDLRAEAAAVAMAADLGLGPREAADLVSLAAALVAAQNIADDEVLVSYVAAASIAPGEQGAALPSGIEQALLRSRGLSEAECARWFAQRLERQAIIKAETIALEVGSLLGMSGAQQATMNALVHDMYRKATGLSPQGDESGLRDGLLAALVELGAVAPCQAQLVQRLWVVNGVVDAAHLRPN